MKKDTLYRPNVGIMLLNKTGKVFVAHRSDNREKAWQMPQGGIDKGEENLKAAVRELLEETGVSSISLIAESTEWYAYDFPENVTFVSKKKKCFIGQTQKWFLFQFDGEDSEVNLDLYHPEFDDWKWVNIEEVVDLIVEFKRNVYEQVVCEFLPFVDAIRKS